MSDHKHVLLTVHLMSSVKMFRLAVKIHLTLSFLQFSGLVVSGLVVTCLTMTVFVRNLHRIVCNKSGRFCWYVGLYEFNNF